MNGIVSSCKQHPLIMLASVLAIVVSIGSTVGWAISYGRLTSVVDQNTLDNNRDRIEMQAIRERVNAALIEQSGRSQQLTMIAEDVREIKSRLFVLLNQTARP